MGLRILRFLIICSACFHGGLCHGADLQEILRRGTITIKSDWAADADYAYIERDEVQNDNRNRRSRASTRSTRSGTAETEE
jgi:hypothetical protein